MSKKGNRWSEKGKKRSESEVCRLEGKSCGRVYVYKGAGKVKKMGKRTTNSGEMSI